MTTRLLITYNSADALHRYGLEPAGIKTCVVDNGSSDETCATARALGFTVTALGTNIGFGAAIMRGLAQIDDDLVFVANPDIKTDENAIGALVDAAKRYPEADLFVPAIKRGDGRTFFRYESQFDERALHRVPPSNEACIRIMSGAAMLVRRKSFLNHGFDPEIFLYFEDDDLSMRYAAEKRQIIYVPQSEVFHGANDSSSFSRATERLKNLSFGWSWGYVMEKHGKGNAKETTRRLLWRALIAFLSLRPRRLRRHLEVREGMLHYLNGISAASLARELRS